MHASLLAHFGALAAKHPESAELYRALPYIIEFCVSVWVLYTFVVKSLRDQFRAISDATVGSQHPLMVDMPEDVDATTTTEPYQDSAGMWWRNKFNAETRELETKVRCAAPPPKQPAPSGVERMASGGFKLGRFG